MVTKKYARLAEQGLALMTRNRTILKKKLKGGRKKEMRNFSYITPGKILERLKKEGLNISRATFYKLEDQGLFTSRRTTGGWRVYTPEEADVIVKLIKENYKLIDNAEEAILEEKEEKKETLEKQD